jgi:hypothetical protein
VIELLSSLLLAFGGVVLFATVALLALLLLMLLWPALVLTLPRLVPLALTLAVVWAWSAALLHSAAQQPPAYMLHDIEIEPQARSVVLGHGELMQNAGLSGSAAERHVQLVQDRGAWSISNIATQRRLRLEYIDTATNRSVEFDSSLVPLRTGDELRLTRSDAGPWHIRFTDVSSDAVMIEIVADGDSQSARRYAVRWSRWTGLHVSGPSGALPPCSAGWRLPSRSGLQRILFALLGNEPQTPLLYFGGPAECAESTASIALAGTSFAAVTLVSIPGIGMGVRRDKDLAAILLRDGREVSLSRPAHPLRARFGNHEFELRNFIAGYTKYQIKPRASGRALLIVPVERSQRVPAPRPCDDMLSSLHAAEVGLGYRARCSTAPQAIDSWAAPFAGSTAFMRGAGALVGWWTAAAAALIRSVVGGLAGRWMISIVGAVFVAAGALVVRIFLRRLGFGRGDALPIGGRLARLIEAQNAIEVFVRCMFLAIAVAVVFGWAGWKVGAAVDRALPISPWPALAAWVIAAVSVAMARGGRLLDGLIMTAWTLLVGVGHVALVSLTLASGEFRSLRYADDTTATIALMAAIVIVASQLGPHWIAERVRSLTIPAGARAIRLRNLVALLRGRRRPTTFDTRAIPIGLYGCIVAIAAFWLLWVTFGSETGVAGFLQPSEAIKTLTIVLLAATVTRALERDRGSEGTLGEFWMSLLLIVGMLTIILVAPFSHTDLSPLVVIVLTACITFLVVVVVHWAAIWSERLSLLNPYTPPPPDTRARRRRVGTALQRFRQRWGARTGLTLRRLSRRPEPSMVGLFLLAALGIWHAGASALADARDTRQWLMTQVSKPELNKPVERVISWLEFNGKPDQKGPLAVEFADVGLQVNRSRDAIAASSCSTWHDAATAIERSAAGWTVAALERVSTAAKWVAHRFLPGCSAQPMPESLATSIATRMPEIQNDFISTWLIVCFGRDGATGIVLVQCTMLFLMALAGFLAIKWSPGQVYDRPAAAVVGFTTIGFAVMLGLQWMISWQNALGLLPVMGQPSTFLSHGPSHAVLFGTPAVLSALLALRVRSAFVVPKAPLRIPRLTWWHIQWRRR